MAYLHYFALVVLNIVCIMEIAELLESAWTMNTHNNSFSDTNLHVLILISPYKGKCELSIMISEKYTNTRVQ